MHKSTAILFGALAALTLTASEDNLLQGKWSSYSPEFAPVAENGVLKAPAENTNAKQTYFASVLTQTIRPVRPGRYDLSGQFKGPMTALWIVLRWQDKDKKNTQAIQKWIPRKQFNPIPGGDGWNKFFCTGVIPAEAVQCMVFVQGFGKKGEIHEFKDLELVESEE